MTGRKSKSNKAASSHSQSNPLCVGQLKLYIGAKIEALDSKDWYQAKVVKITEAARKVLVHFDGWNARHDKWFPFESESLRPLSLSGESSKETHNDSKENSPGDRVLARWSDSKFYPATVCSVVNESTIEVVFYDGFKKHISKSNIRPDRKRAFETFEEKFKSGASPKLPSPIQLSSPADETASPSSNRLKRRHAEPSTMADFVTELPGKRAKKNHPRDGPVAEDSYTQHKDSDIESYFGTPKLGKKKRYSSPSSSTPTTSPALSGSSISPPERQGKAKNTSKGLDVSPEAEIRDEDMSEGAKKTKGDKYPVIKPLKKRKPLSSFLKIKLPMKSPGRKKNKNKDEKEDERTEEKKILDKKIDHRSSDTRIVSDKYDDAKVSDGKEGVGRTQYYSVVRSRESGGLKENLLEARRKSPFSEHGSIDYSKLANDKVRDGLDRDGLPEGSSKDLDLSMRIAEGYSVEKGGKRLPKRERKLTEKGLELQQRIVSKKRHETSCNDSSCDDDDHDDDLHFNISASESSSQIDENKKNEPETGKKDVENRDVCLGAKDDKLTKLPLESGDETGSSDGEKKRRCNIKLVSERKLENKGSECDSEVLLDGKNMEDSGLKLESSDKTGFAKEKLKHSLISNSDQSNNDLKGLKDSAKDLEVAGKEQGLDVAWKEQGLDIAGKEQSLDVVGEEQVTKPCATERLNEPEIVGNDSKTDYFEDRYSDVDSDASLVIDIDDEVKDEDSNVGTNESISKDSIESKEERTKVKQRTYPKLKYTLSHEERKGNRVEKLKKARGRKPLMKNEKKEVMIEKAKRDESCISSPLQSLSKLVADKTEIEVKVLGDVGAQTYTAAQSISPVDFKTDQKPEQKTEQKPNQKPEQKPEQKPNKPVKQARGPSRPRVRMADQFLSMVTQDRPSQIERPISKDLVNEKSAKGRPRNRQPFWSRMQQHGPCEESQDQEIVVYPSDINEPLEFSHARFKEGMTGNLITPPYPNVTSQAHFDQKVSNVKPRKRKLEKSKVEPPKTYGVPCFVPYQSPHFIGGMENNAQFPMRQMSPVEQGVIEPRYVKSPYHIESPPNVSIRSGSPLSEPPGMLPQRPSPHGEQFVCGIQGPRSLHADVIGSNMNKRSPNPLLPPYPGAPMQFVPGFPTYCRPPGPVHPNTQFSAKISNCPCEQCRNAVHPNYAKHPARLECPPARGMPQGSDFLSAVKLEDSIVQSKQPMREDGQDPGFVITNVCSLRDSVKDSKVNDTARTDVLSGASVKHSKEDDTTQSEMFSVGASFKDSKDGAAKRDTLSQGESFKDAKGGTVKTDVLSHVDSIQDSKEDKGGAHSVRDSTQDSYEATSPKAVVDSPRERISDESVVKDHSVLSGHLEGTTLIDSRQADSPAVGKESASERLEKLPGSFETLADSKKLSRSSEKQVDAKPAEVALASKQFASEHIEKLIQSCEKLSDASEKPENAVRDSSFSPANSPSPPATKLTSFETKKKRLDFITGKLSAQKKTKPDGDDKTSEQPGMIIQPSENLTAKPTVVDDKVRDDKVSPTESSEVDNPSVYRKQSPDISLCSSQTPEIIQQRKVLPEGLAYLDPTVPHPEAHFITIAGPPASFAMAQRTSTSPEGQVLYQYPSVTNPGAFMHPQHSGAFIQIPVDPTNAAVSGFYAPQPHRMVYQPNDIRIHPQFFQTPDGRTHMQRFPYGPPLRQVPPPGYVLPREAGFCIPGQAPPPYDPRLMAQAQTSFLPIAPNGRAPLTMCNQQNCSCPLPHASPPTQVMPKPASAPLLGSDEVKTNEEFLAKDKPTPTVPQAAVSQKSKQEQKKESLMKGDPRRLTLPLQRLKKVKASVSSRSAPQGARSVPRKHSDATEDSSGKQRGNREKNTDQKSRSDLAKFDSELAKGVPDAAEDDGKENKPADAASTIPEAGKKNTTKNGENFERSASTKKPEKNNGKEHVFAPKEFVVEQLNLDEYKCTVKGCEKSFRKSSSLDYHTRYFHSPRVPQRKRNPSSTSLLSPDLASGMLPGSNASSPGTPQPPSYKKPSSSSLAESTEVRASNEDLSSIRSGCTGSVMTDDNMSDREKPDIASSDESDESDLESNGTVSVDDIIRCKCGDCEEQGFMIQCEQCLTWQHGDCVQLSIDTVPRKYVCYVCSNPQGLRRSFKYKNNFDWYKRGILPSVVEPTGKDEGKMANISQASHALMEDISNVMDVLEGIKKKLALLDCPLHSSLRFWERKPQSMTTDNANTTNQNNKDPSKDTDSLQIERPEKIENTSIELKHLENLTNKIAEQSEELSDVSSKTVGRDAQINLEHPESESGPPSIISSSKPAEKCDPENSSNNEPQVESSIESEEIERNIAKINLLDHVENIENELNNRMDEIEKSLDLLENEYKKIGDESCENWPRSAFKIALPDVTSIAKHIRLINMHLLDAS